MESRAFYDNQLDLMRKPTPTTPTISAFTATLPGREKILERAVASILPQVDFIQVVMNNCSLDAMYKIANLNTPKITVVPNDNSLEDGSRFIGIEHAEPGYTLVFDDDIIYPPDYVQRLVSAILSYGKNVMVAPMGKVMNKRPVDSYYKGVFRNYKTFDWIPHNSVVQIPGACGVMWDNRRVKVKQEHMLIPNSDICLGKFCKENNVTPIVIAHKADWLTNIWPEAEKGAVNIYGKYKNNDKVLTDFVNKWI